MDDGTVVVDGGDGGRVVDFDDEKGLQGRV